MDQVNDKNIKIVLDMRLLDQYRVKYNKHANAEDLVMILSERVDLWVNKFLVLNRTSKVFYGRLNSIKIAIFMVDDRKRHEDKKEVRVNINSVETNKIFNMDQIRSKMFEKSLFGEHVGVSENEKCINKTSNSAVSAKHKLRKDKNKNSRDKRYRRKGRIY